MPLSSLYAHTHTPWQVNNVCVFAVAGSEGCGELLNAAGPQVCSTRHRPASPGRPVAVSVDDDDLEPVWTDRTNGGGGGVVTSDSDDVDDGKSSSLSSSVADPSTEYVLASDSQLTATTVGLPSTR